MLHDTRIKASKAKPKAYRLGDGKGLFLEIRPTGAKVWIYRYRIDGKANIFTIGDYTQPGPGHISIDDARSERVRCKALVRAGVHPKADRDQQQAVKRAEDGNTFEAIAREWMDKNRRGIGRKRPWTEGTADQVQQVLQDYVFPKIGALPMRPTIPAARIRVIMDEVSELGFANTAIVIRQHCGAIFKYATRTERADGDPTVALHGHIQRPAVKHKKPLTKAGIGEMLAKIETTGFPVTKIALKLLMRLFVRPIELRRAEWTEFDLDAACWIIPAHKMKKRAEHRVPLSTQAVELLRELRTMTGSRKYLFPNHRRPDTYMAEGSLNQALVRIGYKGEFTAHGFRATFSTFAYERGYEGAHIEMQLAHKEKNETKAAYNGAQYWDKRKAMLQEWSDLIDVWSGKSNVIPLRAA